MRGQGTSWEWLPSGDCRTCAQCCLADCKCKSLKRLGENRKIKTEPTVEGGPLPINNLFNKTPYH